MSDLLHRDATFAGNGASHERKALLLLRGIIRRQMLDEFGYIRPTGCLNIIEAGINGDPIATWNPELAEAEMVEHLRNTGWQVERRSGAPVTPQSGQGER